MEVGLSQVRAPSVYLVIESIDQMDLLNELIFFNLLVTSMFSLIYILKTQTASLLLFLLRQTACILGKSCIAPISGCLQPKMCTVTFLRDLDLKSENALPLILVVNL
jgi:hypothetical protein